MALRIEEKLQVPAPLDAVWKFLLDPNRVVGCLPGARLDEVDEERRMRGTFAVQLGPARVTYVGHAEMTVVDADAHRVELVGRGRERGGGGEVKMTMTSRLATVGDGATEVVVEADVRLAGKLVRFGRGMIQSVASELFADFARCLRGELAPASETAAPAAAGHPAAPEAAAHDTAPRSPVAPLPDEPRPLRALPLLWRALRRWLRRLFGRE